MRSGPHVEADDDRVRGRCQQDVALRDRTDAGVKDLDANLLGGHLLQRVGQHFDRSGHVALEDEWQFLNAGLLDLLGQSFERDARRLGQLRLALLHLAVLRDALGLVAIGNDEEGIARIRHAFEAQDLRPGSRAGFLDRRGRDRRTWRAPCRRCCP